MDVFLRRLDFVVPNVLRAITAGRHRAAVGPLEEPVVAYDGSVSDSPETVTLGEYSFEVSYIDPWVPESEQFTASHGGLIVQTGPEEYYVAGSGLTITVSPTTPGPQRAGIESAWEGRFDSGDWKKGRLLNGDQTHQGRHIRLEPDRFSIQKVRFYRYE